MGSDLAAMSTRARREGDHYVVDGPKTFITNGINADLVIVAVKTDPSERHRGISLLVIERDTEGFTRGRNLEKIGQHAQDTAELSFVQARVPVENLLGEEGQGFRYLVSNLPQERLSIAASAVSAAEAALGWTLEYVRERQAFGQPIGSFQSSRFTLAEAARRNQIARAFVDRCAQALNAGELTARGRGDGQVVVHRPAGPRRRSLPAAARRLRLHARVPDRPRLRRRAGDAHIRRHE